MKHFITSLSFVLMAFFTTAQAPDIMNYQAVARNNAGQALANQTIRVRLSVVKNAVVQYSETRQVTTNALGLFNVQIGSSGALSSTGSFANISWQSNAAPGYVLKVELDINNSGLFTDMGSQALVSVPYAFASKSADKATETINIAGRPVDQTTTPAVNSRLSWNGTSWTPVKKDTVMNVALSALVVVFGGGSAPWTFCHTAPVITITGSERIVVNLTGSFAHNGTSSVYTGVSVCYQSTVAGSPVVSFTETQNNESYVPPATSNPMFSKTMLSAAGAITLPPGQYRIGLGIKNKSFTTNLDANGNVNGTIEIRY